MKLNLRERFSLGVCGLVAGLMAAVLVVVNLSVTAVLPALATGWVHHLSLVESVADPEPLLRHRKMAFVASGLAAFALLCLWRSGKSGNKIFRVAATGTLLLAALAIGYAAHLGGGMVYGADFLRMPWSQ
jgi:hypothetical protein